MPVKTNSATHALNTITLAAVAGSRQAISWIAFSYSGTPTGGRLYVQDAGTTILDLDAAAGTGPQLVFNPPLASAAVNTPMTINLADGGSGIVGKLTVGYGRA